LFKITFILWSMCRLRHVHVLFQACQAKTDASRPRRIHCRRVQENGQGGQSLQTSSLSKPSYNIRRR
jgi:hypothetical protein